MTKGLGFPKYLLFTHFANYFRTFLFNHSKLLSYNMIFVRDVIFISRQTNDTMLSVWKEYMFCSFKSFTIILNFKHEPISILSRRVYILHSLTYLSHYDVFTTLLHVFLDNIYPWLSTFLFYYRFTKKLSKGIYGNPGFMTSLGTSNTCWCFELAILPEYLILPTFFT